MLILTARDDLLSRNPPGVKPSRAARRKGGRSCPSIEKHSLFRLRREANWDVSDPSARPLDRRLHILLQALPPALQTPTGLATFQSGLVSEIRLSERRSRTAADGGESCLTDERAYRQRLRVLGDTIAWLVLGGHAVRSLGRSPRPPTGLDSQGTALDAVVALTRQVAAEGGWPVLSDLTNVISTGDLIVTRGAGLGDARASLEVIECKSRATTTSRPLTGRLARQRDRGVAAAYYLERGHMPSTVDLQDSTAVVAPDAGSYVAVDGEMPGPPWSSVADVVARARSSPNGLALLTYDDGDYLLAALNTDASEQMQALSAVLREAVPGTNPVMAVHTERVRDPLPITPPIVSFPLAPDDWLALLTGQLLLVRLVDLGLMEGSHCLDGVDVSLSVGDPASATPFLANVCGHDYHLGLRYLEEILYGFQPIGEIARAGARFAAKAYKIVAADGGFDVNATALAAASPGPPVRYTTRIITK